MMKIRRSRFYRFNRYYQGLEEAEQWANTDPYVAAVYMISVIKPI